MKQLLAALRFLTILPLPGSGGTAEDALAGSVPWFPVVGLLLGAVAAAAAWALSLAAPPMVVAALIVILLLSFSGCLHLDGLSDTADGFFSSRSRERILEIMKDSHIGAMGVVAIVGVLLLKFAALASLPDAKLWPAVLLMPLAGRSAIVLHMALLPYARPDGSGKVFYRRRPRWAAAWAIAVLVAVAYGVRGTEGLVIGAGCLAVTLAFSGYVYHKIGGATGDTLGAVCEIIEAVPAVTLAMAPLCATR